MNERIADSPHVSTIPRGPTFAEAKSYTMPIGKYVGRTLDQIATTDQGLLYCDWLLGQRDYKSGLARTPSANERELTAMLRAYLADPTIARELVAAQQKGGR